MEISVQAQKDAVVVDVLKDAQASEREKQRAFNELYARHQKQVGIYFSKKFRDADLAEDLKMITFEKIHENIQNFDSARAVFSTWMYTIAKNVMIDHKRKEDFEVLSIDALATKVSDNHDGMEFQIMGDSLSPEQVMIRQQNKQAVLKAIDGISSPKIRRIMTYRFIDELSFKEIAEREGVDVESSTLRVSSTRGQKILSEKLANL